jgi:glutaredoxin
MPIYNYRSDCCDVAYECERGQQPKEMECPHGKAAKRVLSRPSIGVSADYQQMTEEQQKRQNVTARRLRMKEATDKEAIENFQKFSYEVTGGKF